MPVKVLTVAGSDSGGAAGLQADLKTLTALRAYGMSVVTVVTAQNSISLETMQPLSADLVAAQLDAVLSDYGADAVKTGFIGRADLIATIAAKLRLYQLTNIIIDPVLVDHRDRPMFAQEVTGAYVSHLLPLADLVTPTSHEAALLAGYPYPEDTALDWVESVARTLHGLGPKHVLIKAGRFGRESVDIFYDGVKFSRFSSPWIETENTHGSGDTFSAAVCACLAQGESMRSAVERAHRFTANAIQRAANWELGRGHGPLAHF